MYMSICCILDNENSEGSPEGFSLNLILIKQ